MKNLHLLIVFGLLLPFGCKAQNSRLTQGKLVGNTGIYEGNCMPSPGVEPCKPRQISLELIITALSEVYDSTQLVMAFRSNGLGEFVVNLPAGIYSLFVKDGNEVVCTQIQCEKDCHCYPVRITSGESTRLQVYLDHAVW